MMKLGTQTASLINHMQSRAVIGQPEPVPGMGVTVLLWTDRKAGTIFRVIRERKTVIIEVRDDRSVRTDKNGAFSEAQDHEFKTDINGARSYFRRQENGMWTEVVKNSETGRWNKRDGRGLRIGEREEYRDPCF